MVEVLTMGRRAHLPVRRVLRVLAHHVPEPPAQAPDGQRRVLPSEAARATHERAHVAHQLEQEKQLCQQQRGTHNEPPAAWQPQRANACSEARRKLQREEYDERILERVDALVCGGTLVGSWGCVLSSGGTICAGAISGTEGLVSGAG